MHMQVCILLLVLILVHVYILPNAYTCTNAYKNTCIRFYEIPQMRTKSHRHAYICRLTLHTNIHKNIHTCSCTCMHAYMHIRYSIYLCFYLTVCMYAFAFSYFHAIYMKFCKTYDAIFDEFVPVCTLCGR